MNSYTKIALDGLWHNNTSFVQLLGLCPLLAVTGTVINGLGLGLATTLVFITTNVLVSLFRHMIPQEIRIPVFVLIIAASVTALEQAMQAYYYDLYLVLGIFIPLIVTNCTVIGRAEAFAVRNPVGKALLDGLAMGVGFIVALVSLGALREIIGHGTLLAQAHLMFGEGAREWTITVIPAYRGFLLAVLPPGAFIGLGLLIAVKKKLDGLHLRHRQPVKPEPVDAVVQAG